MLVEGAIQNAADEVREGSTTLVRVAVAANGLVVVEDNGVGFPELPKHEGGPPAIEVIFAELLACNCGCDQKPGHRRSADGLPAAVINALSKRLTVETVHDGCGYRLDFDRGTKRGPLVEFGPKKRRGSRLEFLPDYKLFGNLSLEIDRVRKFANTLFSSFAPGKVVVSQPPGSTWFSEG